MNCKEFQFITDNSYLKPQFNFCFDFKGLTRFQRKGMLLEMATSKALQRLKVKHRHNSFDYHYAFETEGTDLQTRKREIECKNLNGNYRVSFNWLKEEITSRFPSRKKKVAIFSMDVLSKAKKRFLRRNKVRTMFVGFQVTYSNFGKAVDRLTELLVPVLLYSKRVIVSNVIGTRLVNCYSKLVGFSYRIDATQRFLTDFRGFGVG